MRRVVWRKAALMDLNRHHEWLSSLERSSPDKTMRVIEAAAESLARLGDIGRPSRIPGVRELSVRSAPYVIAYRLEEDRVDILAVYHTAQRR